jgi:anti-anti-sigma factor
MPLDIETYTEGSVLVIRFLGQLDSSTALKAQQDILALLSPTVYRVAMDMDELEFLSSAGMRVLLAVLRETRSMGGDLRLARLQPMVKDVVSMGFATMIKIYGTVPGVIASFEPEAATVQVVEGTPPAPRQKWTNEFLDQMRMIGDPPADRAVQELFEEGEVEAVNELMRNLVSNDYVPPSDLPPAIRRYLENTTDLPAWADWSRIKRGQALFERFGVQIVTILFCGSLPISYAARKGVHVLWLTNRMNQSPYRRIIETAQMVLDVMNPGGLQRDGAGLRSAQKVRLVHAAIRHLLLARGLWDTAAYDYPINQEDLAGTLMTFSHAITVGLPKLGAHLHPQEIEDYLHTWKLVGYAMGISPEMLPDNAADAQTLSDTIFQRQIVGTRADNVEGEELTTTLLKLLAEMIPTRAFDDLPKALARHLIGDSVADLLGIEPVSWQGALMPLQWANALLDQTGDIAPIVGKATGVVFRQVMKGLMLHNLGGQRAAFSIPDSLQQKWELASSNDSVPT